MSGSVRLFLKRFCTQLENDKWIYCFNAEDYPLLEIIKMKWDCFNHVLHRDEFVELLPYLTVVDKDVLFDNIMNIIEIILTMDDDSFNEYN